MKNTLKYFFSLLFLINISFSQNFTINQSQQQSVYFIESATFDNIEISSDDLILARTESGSLVGLSQYNGYGTDLVIMGKDLDIFIDGQPYSICETTGTCNYPINGDNIYLTLYDSSTNQEFIPYLLVDNVSNNAQAIPQSIQFSTLINENLLSLAVLTDCDGVLGGDATLDECSVCNGSGIPQGDCDCFGNIVDCDGVCGGSATLDNCGTCDDNPQNDCACLLYTSPSPRDS